MSYNRQVCQAFFDFESELNKGYGIVSSIYHLINRNRLNNQSYYDSLDYRIRREAKICKTVAQFLSLQLLCWRNLPGGLTKWSVISYVFYVTSIIDEVARSRLSSGDYDLFKEGAETNLTNVLDISVLDTMTQMEWELFEINENFYMCEKTCPALVEAVVVFSVFYALYKIL